MTKATAARAPGSPPTGKTSLTPQDPILLLTRHLFSSTSTLLKTVVTPWETQSREPLFPDPTSAPVRSTNR